MGWGWEGKGGWGGIGVEQDLEGSGIGGSRIANILSPIWVLISLSRYTWTCPSNFSGTSPCRPILVLEAQLRVKEQIFLYHADTIVVPTQIEPSILSH